MAGRTAHRVYGDHEFGVTNGYGNESAAVSMDVNDCLTCVWKIDGEANTQPAISDRLERKEDGHTDKWAYTNIYTDGRTDVHIYRRSWAITYDRHI